MTNDHIDTLWQRALKESIQAGEEFTRYRFAALIEAETARRCVDHINGHSTVDDRSGQMIAGIQAEFPEAWK